MLVRLVCIAFFLYSSTAQMASRALVAAAAVALVRAQNSTCDPTGAKPLATFTATLLNGSAFSFADWAGDVVVVTNVASF